MDIPPTSSTCYNGNIAATTWTYQGETNGYMYYYDDKNRFNLCYSILDSIFADGKYSESMQYDRSDNIRQLIRWDERDAMNYLHYTYDGNQVTKVTDEGYYPVDYSCKRYMDLADVSQEMDYDANGNLIYDLDRQIVAIRYNILNLPDTVQFANGNQIINHYDALGTRYKTSYRTRKVAATVPLGETLTATDNVSDYTILSYVMDKNKKYLSWSDNSLTLEYVFNSEGYYANLTDAYFYYVKDHLGNIRETYVYPWENYKECVQRMQYYPSGLPWNDNFNASEQPYKYNGKEFVEMHGYDTYDYGFRGYYPALGRFTSVDLLAEKYHGATPYAYCLNNPINAIDLFGLDRYDIDEANGRVVNRIEQDGQDTVRIVRQEGEKYIPVTTKDENGKETTKELSLDDGAIKWEQIQDGTNTYDIFTIENADAGEQLFYFLATNTKVEYSFATIGTPQRIKSSILTTSHQKGEEKSFVYLLKNQYLFGGYIQEHFHNHPNDIPYPSGLDTRGGDISFATYMSKRQPTNVPIFWIYVALTSQLIQYDEYSTHLDIDIQLSK